MFDASLMNFINIGEMADRLSKELKDRHADIDWQKVKDFRNLVAHDYLGVDAEEVWQIIKNDLPILRNAVDNLLSDLSRIIDGRRRTSRCSCPLRGRPER